MKPFHRSRTVQPADDGYACLPLTTLQRTSAVATVERSNSEPDLSSLLGRGADDDELQLSAIMTSSGGGRDWASDSSAGLRAGRRPKKSVSFNETHADTSVQPVRAHRNGRAAPEFQGSLCVCVFVWKDKYIQLG